MGEDELGGEEGGLRVGVGVGVDEDLFLDRSSYRIAS